MEKQTALPPIAVNIQIAIGMTLKEAMRFQRKWRRTHFKVVTARGKRSERNRAIRRKLLIKAIPRAYTRLRSDISLGGLEAFVVPDNDGDDDDLRDELGEDQPFPAKKKVSVPQKKKQDLDWVFKFKRQSGNGAKDSSGVLSESVKAPFLEKFKDDFLSTDTHRERYEVMMADKHASSQQDRCVGKVTHAYKESDTRSGLQNDDTACALCLKKRRLCARIVKENEMWKLAFYPLPESERPGVPWDLLDYWVRGQKDGA
ncbi:hypothetical protein BKA66DRAFT_112716 [Pyrenochaeta sp. MPI-SDFR-AT-0127]|nr:hypothetical protein BKA66DRAFT_112716 [Pyrenochaeta sp. MPI-SDFR-AT-0127]